MRVEINTSQKATKLAQLENIFQGFIEDKMSLFKASQEQVAEGTCVAIPFDKYLASLWMVLRIMQLLDEQEIAKKSGVSYESLCAWKQEKSFNDLVTAHYRELLQDIIDLLA
ncbi:MAG: hypothetical protein WCQ99_09465 [Pseudomonadota bacterium]